jgi:hypothetical protein
MTTWDWYNRPVVAAVPSGLSLTPLTIIKNNKKSIFSTDIFSFSDGMKLQINPDHDLSDISRGVAQKSLMTGC